MRATFIGMSTVFMGDLKLLIYPLKSYNGFGIFAMSKYKSNCLNELLKGHTAMLVSDGTHTK